MYWWVNRETLYSVQEEMGAIILQLWFFVSSSAWIVLKFGCCHRSKNSSHKPHNYVFVNDVMESELAPITFCTIWIICHVTDKARLMMTDDGEIRPVDQCRAWSLWSPLNQKDFQDL